LLFYQRVLSARGQHIGSTSTHSLIQKALITRSLLEFGRILIKKLRHFKVAHDAAASGNEGWWLHR
jgi:hypothetical protein